MGLMAQEQQLGMGLAHKGDGGEVCLQEVLSVQTLMQVRLRAPAQGPSLNGLSRPLTPPPHHSPEGWGEKAWHYSSPSANRGPRRDLLRTSVPPLLPGRLCLETSQSLSPSREASPRVPRLSEHLSDRDSRLKPRGCPVFIHTCSPRL